MSVGAVGAERKITNVAAGVDPTDAVNVSQLTGLGQNFPIVGSKTTINAFPTATGADALAAGYGAAAAGNNAAAFGTSASASGPNGTAVGSQSLASGASAAAFGQGSSASAGAATAIGAASQASGVNTTAVGAQAAASGLNSSAFGVGSLASAPNSTAIGQLAQATAVNAVALGLGSVADQADTVSVGKAGAMRRIVNVAPGIVGTDAVNVDQLSAIGVSFPIIGNNIGGFAFPSATGANALAAGFGASAAGATATALGTQASASGPSGTALGAQAVSTGNNSVALGAGSTDGGVANVVSVGAPGAERRIVNVADGTLSAASKDAVNGSQLFATNQNVTQNTTNIANLTTGITDGTIGLVQQDPATRTITVGAATDGTVVSMAGTTGDRRISGVATGVALTDAVNVGQLTTAIDNSTSNVPLRANNTSALPSPVASGADGLSGGFGSTASGKNATSYGTSSARERRGSDSRRLELCRRRRRRGRPRPERARNPSQRGRHRIRGHDEQGEPGRGRHECEHLYARRTILVGEHCGPARADAVRRLGQRRQPGAEFVRHRRRRGARRPGRRAAVADRQSQHDDRRRLDYGREGAARIVDKGRLRHSPSRPRLFHRHRARHLTASTARRSGASTRSAFRSRIGSTPSIPSPSPAASPSRSAARSARASASRASFEP